MPADSTTEKIKKLEDSIEQLKKDNKELSTKLEKLSEKLSEQGKGDMNGVNAQFASVNELINTHREEMGRLFADMRRTLASRCK